MFASCTLCLQWAQVDEEEDEKKRLGCSFAWALDFRVLGAKWPLHLGSWGIFCCSFIGTLRGFYNDELSRFRGPSSMSTRVHPAPHGSRSLGSRV